MLARIVCCVLVCALLAGPVVIAQAPLGEGATKAEVNKLRAQAQALLAQAQALEAERQQAQAERQAAEKYMRALAESCLDSILKGDSDDILPVVTEELKVRYSIDKGNTQNRQSLDVIRRQGISVSAYKITSTTIAPNWEEALFRAEVAGKSRIEGERGKEKAATIVLRIQKEKGHYALGFMSAVIVK